MATFDTLLKDSSPQPKPIKQNLRSFQLQGIKMSREDREVMAGAA